MGSRRRMLTTTLTGSSVTDAAQHVTSCVPYPSVSSRVRHPAGWILYRKRPLHLCDFQNHLAARLAGLAHFLGLFCLAKTHGVPQPWLYCTFGDESCELSQIGGLAL